MIGNTIGGYTLTREIGSGGMAAVYEAKHNKLGHLRALKCLHPQFAKNAEIKKRFLREAKLLISLDHPNIVNVIDYIEEGGQLAIVMELLEGIDLNLYIDKHKALPTWRAKAIAKECLSALDYVHSKGILHRDLKPSNLIVLTNGSIKIVDFGIAKLFGTGKDSTTMGRPIGTPNYMSPEQIKGIQSIDHRSDIYSLGVTLFYALKGKVPFQGDNPHTTYYNILNKPLPTFSSGDLDFTKSIQKACEKDSNKRHQSCEDWLLSLQDTILETKGAGIEPRPKQTIVSNPLNNKKTRSKPPAAQPTIIHKEQPKGEKLPASNNESTSASTYLIIIIVLSTLLSIVGLVLLNQEEEERYGCIEGDCQSWAVYKYENGDRYEGSFSDNLPKGEGTMTYANGDSYEGKWTGGKKQGMGKYTWANGDMYLGNWIGGKKQGKGKFTWTNGDRYNGEWDNDLMSGKGTKTYSSNPNLKQIKGKWYKDSLIYAELAQFRDGAKYNGGWKGEEREGEGSLTLSNADKYIGSWKDGKCNRGKIFYSNGDKYEGAWVNWKPYGKGVVNYNYRSQYKSFDGTWSNGEPDSGKMEYRNSGDLGHVEYYEGYWKGYMWHGKGTIRWRRDPKDQHRLEYTGYFENDSMSGAGILTYSNKNYLDGWFKGNNAHGDCTYHYVDHGVSFTTEWKNGEFEGRVNGMRYGRERKINYTEWKEGLARFFD